MARRLPSVCAAASSVLHPSADWLGRLPVRESLATDLEALDRRVGVVSAVAGHASVPSSDCAHQPVLGLVNDPAQNLGGLPVVVILDRDEDRVVDYPELPRTRVFTLSPRAR